MKARRTSNQMLHACSNFTLSVSHQDTPDLASNRPGYRINILLPNLVSKRSHQTSVAALKTHSRAKLTDDQMNPASKTNQGKKGKNKQDPNPEATFPPPSDELRCVYQATLTDRFQVRPLEDSRSLHPGVLCSGWDST